MSQVYTPLVYQWCRQAGLQPQDASDLVQEVFLGLLKSLKQFRKERPGDTFRGWLWTVTRRRILDHWRKQNRQVQGTGGTTAQQWMAQFGDLPEEELPDDAGVHAKLVQRAISLMRKDFEERTWNAFWLTAIEQKTAQEAATALDMTTANVYVAKSRVLRRLRQEFAGLDLLD